MSTLHRWIIISLAGFTAGYLCAAEPTAPPAAIPKLPVTTGWLGNSLLRGGQADWMSSMKKLLPESKP